MENKSDETLPPLQRALLAIKELRARLEASERAKTEPIAVIGLGCRFPGGADSPEAFWRLLRDGIDAVTTVPADRWDGDALYDPDFLVSGKINTREAGFLDQVDRFDAAFFGISPREAAHMDPQQRLLLETAYEALEAAGQPLEQLAGSQTGVFVGIHSSSSDYALLQYEDPAIIDMHTSTGTAHSIVANRLSYVFDWQGPSLAVDTACSSSLVTIHLACQSLRNRDCDMALAGGVNLILTPEFTISASKMQALSPDGRCKTFDAAADGFGRGEGCGVIVLKRLSDALAGDDPILAVIAGSAVNQDGATNGLTAPNGLSQQDVIRRALAMAGVEPSQISYVETHGTGTVLGDPIEVEALAEVIGPPRPDGRACVLGSVKTNIGHLEGAAGIAGLIKVILALRHETIPRHLHFKQLNPHISLVNTPFVIPTTELPWPAGADRYAGVSSFGFGGTNAHIIVGEAPRAPVAEAGETLESAPVCLLPLSARSEPALKELAQAYQTLLAGEGVALADVAYTAGQRRSHHTHRLAVVGHTPAVIAERLAAFLHGETHADLAAGSSRPAAQRGLAFVFSGQGAHLLGMGRDLLAAEPVFRDKITECDALLRPHAGWSLLEELTAAPEASRLESNAVAQPAIFAVQVALAALLRSWGIEPEAVVGHSVGEVAAAHVAGILSLPDAIRVIYHRGRVIQQATGSGRMAAVSLSQAAAEQLLAGYQGRLSLAAVNSPVSTILSGEPVALEAVIAELGPDGFGRMLPAVNYASHSHVMEPYSRELTRSLAGLTPQPAAIPVYSTVSGSLARAGDYDAGYWGRNLRQPVLFAPALAALAADGPAAFLEIGPHPLLTVPMSQCLERSDAAVLTTLRRDQPERDSLLRSAAVLYAQGYSIRWSAVNPPGALTRLPGYPWQRRRFWVKAPSRQKAAAAVRTYRNPLLGGRLRAPLPTFEMNLGAEALAFLEQHRFFDAAVLPTTAFVEMARAAAGEALGSGPLILQDLSIREALLLPEDEPAIVQLALTPQGRDEATFQIYSQKDEAGAEWTLHATGMINRAAGGASGSEPVDEPIGLPAIQARCPEVNVEAYYQQLARRGLAFGPAFQGVSRLWRGPGEALGRIEVTGPVAASGDLFTVHPAFLDACLQPLAAALPGDERYLLIGLDQLRLDGGNSDDLIGGLPAVVWSYARLRPDSNGGAETIIGDVTLHDASGRAIGRAEGLLLRRAAPETMSRRAVAAPDAAAWLYDVIWQPQSLTEEPESAPLAAQLPGQWLVFANGDELAGPLAARLRELGQAAILITAGDAYRAVDATRYHLDPLKPEHLGRLLSETTEPERPLRGIVYLGGPAEASAERSPEELTAAQQRLAGGALQLMQALARWRGDASPRLWLVTRGAQPIGAEPVTPLHSTLWGLGRVMALEHPDRWGGLVDLGQTFVAEQIACLLRELLSSDKTGEDQVAWRDEQRYVARLARDEATTLAPAGKLTTPAGAHLITGGLGGLGLKIAHWMAERGARHLVLTSRTGLPERGEWATLPAGSEAARRVAGVQAIEALGATVTALALDVADEAQMAALFSQFGRALPPLRGVLHAAAALDMAPLAEMSVDGLLAMFRAKVAGSWTLHRLTGDMNLNYFVLFSSTTALWGVNGMAHYAAANCFLDSLAHHRRAAGLPALSVNWGLWAEARLFSGEEQARMARFGLEPMPVDRAMATLERLLEGDAAQKVVAAVDWATLKPTYEARRPRPFLSQVESFAPPAAALPRTAPTLTLAQQLEALPPDERNEFLLGYVGRQVAYVMGHDDSQPLEVERGLFEIGMDSLMAVELKNRLETAVGRRLPAGLTFNYPNIRALATFLAKELWGEGAAVVSAAPPASAPSHEEAAADLEAVSEQELLALFDDELAAIEGLDL